MNAEELTNILFEWQHPAIMESRVKQLGELLGIDAMQRRGRAFREGWVASRFALRTDCELVRLLPESHIETTPDFAVRREGVEQRFETTEADIPGRRRQLEYRFPESQTVEFMTFTSLRVMVDHMRVLTAKKAAKVYADCSGLVVWLNPPMFSFEPRLRSEQLIKATEPAALAFDEVWVLREKGVLLWKAGLPRGPVPDDF